MSMTDINQCFAKALLDGNIVVEESGRITFTASLPAEAGQTALCANFAAFVTHFSWMDAERSSICSDGTFYIITQAGIPLDKALNALRAIRDNGHETPETAIISGVGASNVHVLAPRLVPVDPDRPLC